MLAYAGLRPGEAPALRWSDVRDRTLLVERAVALGEVSPTKTRRIRTVRLLSPLVDDLAVLREHSSGEGDSLVVPTRRGEPWSEQAYRGWRRRVFKPAATAAGVDIGRPYDLRHSFIPLLLAEGQSVVDVAAQAGHAPTMTLDTYAHVIDELTAGERAPAEGVIYAARAKHVPPTFPRARRRHKGRPAKGADMQGFRRSPLTDSNR